MKDFRKKTMVVTGAGNGIGRAIAREGALRGMNLVLNDIDAVALESAVNELRCLGVRVSSLAADITVYDNIQALHNLAIHEFGVVDVLINNAGVSVSGAIWMLPKQDIDWITEANFLSHAYVLNVFMPDMVAGERECEIVDVASGAGIMISGSAVMYHSTKFADVAMSESTYLALKSRGLNHVHMHVLCPAFVQTEIHLADKHRPERYSDMSDPYYKSEEYKSGLIRSKRQVLSGIPLDSIGMSVFNALEEGDFYILTHPEMLIPAAARIDNLINGRNP